MKGKYNGHMSLVDFYQAFYQDRGFLEGIGINYVRDPCVLITPCDEHGNAVFPLDESGRKIDGWISAGPYRSAAATFEKLDKPQNLETRAVTHLSRSFSPL